MIDETNSDPMRRLLLSLDDIEAQQDPGFAYAVYLVGLSGERQHVGNLSLFGIRPTSDPTRPQDIAQAAQHVFDATDAVNVLRVNGDFDASSINVMFEPIRVVPPPGTLLPAEVTASGSAPPVRVGRISLYVT